MSFKSAYQGGPYFELFTTQGPDFMSNWKDSSSGVKKIYEKDVKSYVLILEGSPATTKLSSPKDQKQSLTLIQRFLVLQLCLPKGGDFSLELGMTDMGNNKRRILLTTSQKETHFTPLHAKIPLTIIKRAVWLNLVIDMVSFVGETWINQTFRCLDQISISANCKLRRVFTMKSQPPDTTDDDELYGCLTTNTGPGELDSIPKPCQLTSNVVQQTQVLTLNKIRYAEQLKSAKSQGLQEQFRQGSIPDLDLSFSGRRNQAFDSKIAFGSKAPRAPEVSRKISQQSNYSSRSFRSQIFQNENNSSSVSTSDIVAPHDDVWKSRNQNDALKSKLITTGPVPGLSGLSCNHQQSDLLTQDIVDLATNDSRGSHHVFQQPHPPRQPSNDRVRRRPRIKSLGQNTVPGEDLNLKHSAVCTEYDSIADVISLLHGTDSKTDHENHSSHILTKNSHDGGDKKGQNVNKNMINENERTEILIKDPHLSKGGVGEDDDEDSSLSTSASESSHPREYEESDDDASGEVSKLHTFSSQPKSACIRRNVSPSTADFESKQLRKSTVKSSRSDMKCTEVSSNHGARLEDDFISQSSSDDDPAAVAHLMQHQKFVYGESSAGSQYILSNHIQSSIFSITSYQNTDYYMDTLTTNPKSSKCHTTSSIPTKSSPANVKPQSSASPNQRLNYNLNKSVTMSRMSKNFLREIDKPLSEGFMHSLNGVNKLSDGSKYKKAEMTDSFEAVMLATMAQEAEDELENIPSDKDLIQLQAEHSYQQIFNPYDVILIKHLNNESPATTSDDDTSFSTWKAPVLNQIPYNYQDEMKFRRSSDTLTSSNPRDWSGVMSPPIGSVSGDRDLQGTMEGISDLSDEAVVAAQEQGVNSTKGEEEKLDLIFDPKLSCYYDPKTKKYYELVT